MRSYRIALDPKRRVAARFFGDVVIELQRSLMEEKKARGLKQADIAKELGVDRANINRRFLYGANLTLRSLAELAWVLKRKPVFKLEPMVAVEAGSNESCDHWATVCAKSSHVFVSSARATEIPVSASAGLKKVDDKMTLVGAA